MTVGVKIGSERPPHAANSEVSLEAIYREHAAFVWRTLRRLGVREADVSDVSQEVFLAVHRHRHAYDPEVAPVRAWLVGFARRAASDYRRRAHVRREALDAILTEGRVEPVQDRELELRRRRALLDRALEELDEDKRVAFVLYELEEMPLAEIAAAMGAPLQTIYSRLQAARSQVEASVRRALAVGRSRS